TERLLRAADQVHVESLIPPERLTPRETEVVRLMSGGYSNREIAYALGTAEGTIKNQVSSILAKFGVRDRTRAVLKALETGPLAAWWRATTTATTAAWSWFASPHAVSACWPSSRCAIARSCAPPRRHSCARCAPSAARGPARWLLPRFPFGARSAPASATTNPLAASAISPPPFASSPCRSSP